MKFLEPYLIFNGNAREAMTFYLKNLGGDLHMVTFGEMPPSPDGKTHIPPEAKDRIMHARISNGSAVLMSSDNMPGMPFTQGNNFSISIACENIPEAEKLFAGLGENGKVTMPLQETFWATRFGMLTDKFGINWMFNLEKPHSKKP